MNNLFLTTLISTLICNCFGSLMSLDRPTPYAPDYAPDCDLIVPGLQHQEPEIAPLVPASAGLQYLGNYVPSIRRSTYMPTGQVCISYDDINRAVGEATALLGGYVPPEVNELSSDFPKPPHIAVISEILTKASQLLAKWYGLTKTAVLFGLPRIDTYKTAIRDICPTFLKPVKCELSKYRTLTGMCNNLNYPSWGSARSAMLRFLPPDYADGITEPKKSSDGTDLPPARLVSFVVHQDISAHDRHLTYMAIAWGQMIDHDLTLAPSPTDEKSENIKCCEFPPDRRHPSCYPIQIPANDPFYKYFDRQCMDFLRSMSGVKPNCPLGPRSQQNSISSFIDANFIYGSTQEVASRLREFSGGRLKTSPIYRELGMKDLLPMKTKEPELGCERTGRPHNLYCFDGGDERLNEQLQLTVIHTVWMREHNRIAGVLQHLNPHWDDEVLYQETRRILGAIVAHITFNEFLPVIIGRKAMSSYGLDLMPKGYYEGYNPKINPGVRTAFQAAAFRFGHSILPDVTERYNKYHEKVESIRLSTLLRQPYELYKPGAVDSFMLGLVNQLSYRMDSEITTEVTNHLFEKPGEKFGLDLAAMNIQRAREMGLPGYNAYREYCGLPKIKSFYELHGLFPNKTIQRYMNLYQDVNDLDLWSAGIAEYPMPGAVVGPTFACIIGEQFSHVRRGDRFWYENAGWPSQFTPEQLTELRKAKLARLLCENSDDIHTIQLYPMLKANPHTNPRVECQVLPSIDLSPWTDTEYISNEYKRA